LEDGGGYEKLWKEFTNDDYESPFDSDLSLEEFKK